LSQLLNLLATGGGDEALRQEVKKQEAQKANIERTLRLLASQQDKLSSLLVGQPSANNFIQSNAMTPILEIEVLGKNRIVRDEITNLSVDYLSEEILVRGH
jgi:hypothetical protein